MLNRAIKNTIIKTLSNFPIVGILGSRQVGKTTLAKDIQRDYSNKSIYLDLELPSDLNKLQDPELFLQQHTDDLVVIDEIQRLPELFPVLRALIDKKKGSRTFSNTWFYISIFNKASLRNPGRQDYLS